MTTQQFKKEFQIDVPAKGVFGDPPKRELKIDFTLPGNFAVQREENLDLHGLIVLDRNPESMDETGFDVQPIDNGVRVSWGLANPHTFPVTGRTGHLRIALTGVQQADNPVQLDFSSKYKKLRKRFFKAFYYAGHIAVWVQDNKICFGDQTIYMGQTMIFLATEVYIKRQLGQNYDEPLTKIKEILAAIDRLDQVAESLYGHVPTLNGFIIRDDITGPNDPRLQARFTEVKSDWQKPEDAAPSGDQVFGLMYGLWFIVRYVEDPIVVTQARQLAGRIFLHLKNQKFELKLPDGQPVERGGDVRWLASLLHGLNRDITGQDLFDECRISVLGQDIKLNSIAAFWDQVGDEAAQVLRTELDIPPLGKMSINSFAAHILLMAIAPTSIWTQQQFEDGALAVNHHLALLFYAAAHNIRPLSIHFNVIAKILDQCPERGPRGDLPVQTGWQKDNRWIRCSNIDEPGDGQFAYNGVDFLMLHNLALIIFSR